jgi:adenylate kinase
MRLILLGAPGAGKGTISKLITESKGLVQISTGDILRQAIKDGSQLGKKAEDYMKKGELVPDALVLDIIKIRITHDDCSDGFILDGFPRTLPQAEALGAMFTAMSIELDAAVNIVVPRDIIIKRLTSRRTCSNTQCQAIYNIESNPPKDGVHCNKCGSPVIQRDDETETAIAKRLSTYEEKTAPLVDYYRREGLLVEINGNLSPEKVFDELMTAIKK